MAKKKLPILVKNDPWLEPYADEIQGRIDRYKGRLDHIKKNYKKISSNESTDVLPKTFK